ncbi:imidazole glycerol phosphate synthase subunit HisH [Alphaproteobacteria bacterium]|nr:imidazole glycerol phosphate synthase subunit HisH [Alphaproteobacteria bacterium]MDB2635818.1 imidazole glycerol phosphate synthase subunit HisH [Alphaproteobacteria bacterium]MDC0594842.1 imidazole glycerol phosphate synthase subunit HisH [Alphaproteobacteria bacterium]
MKKKVLGLIDGQSGNIGSIKKAIKDLINEKPYQLKIIQGNFNPNNFDKIILPGQGAYATLISNLKKLKIIRPLKQYLDDNKSYLGICVGMQILSDEGHEDQITKGLGIISGKIKKFSNKKLIIPHMGWNTISVNKADPIVKKNLNEKDFYFVHSYIYENINKENILGLTTYGKNFPSIINKGNIYGVQFHPEKSHKNGLKLIKNFIMKS